MTRREPPKHLGRDGRELWCRIIEEYAVQDGAGEALLGVACEALDRMRAAQRAIAKDGETVRDRYGQVKVHPATILEKDSRAGFLAALRALNLDLEPVRDGPGRPPGKV